MKEHFPLLTSTDIVYLDSAATTQKPAEVIRAITNYYETSNANVHRSAHALARKATTTYEEARTQAAKLLETTPQQIILTSGTTHAFNLLAHALPITKDSVIILSELEHHANIVPWQQTEATIKYIPVKNGRLDMLEAEKLISEGCDIVSLHHLSNVTGSITDVQELARLARAQNALVFVDGAQAVAHLDVNVQELGVDAYAFSAHKLYGPTGIGALYIQEELLHTLKPFMTGGEMIDTVSKEQTTFRTGNARFEPGTPPIAQAAGMSEAIQWFMQNKDFVSEDAVMQYAYEQLASISEVHIISCSSPTACLSFVVEEIDSSDIAAYLDTKGVAIRSGHHCAQILHEALGLASSARISIACYTTTQDIDVAISALQEAIQVLRGTTQ